MSLSSTNITSEKNQLEVPSYALFERWCQANPEIVKMKNFNRNERSKKFILCLSQYKDESTFVDALLHPNGGGERPFY
eukprot:scaffold572_cov163-Ochromonas_danica.AAC.2